MPEDSGKSFQKALGLLSAEDRMLITRDVEYQCRHMLDGDGLKLNGWQAARYSGEAHRRFYAGEIEFPDTNRGTASVTVHRYLKLEAVSMIIEALADVLPDIPREVYETYTTQNAGQTEVLGVLDILVHSGDVRTDLYKLLESHRLNRDFFNRISKFLKITEGKIT